MGFTQQEGLYRIHEGFNGKSIMMFKGPFAKSSMSLFSCYFGDMLYEKPLIKKKIMSVFIEMSQNISMYSSEKETDKAGLVHGIGFMSITQTDVGYSLVSGNIASENNLQRLKHICDTINRSSRSELRVLKRKLWNEVSQISESANIGLVQSALIAGSGVQLFQHRDDSGKDFVTLQIDIKI